MYHYLKTIFNIVCLSIISFVRKTDENMLKRGLWSPEEDEKLVNYMSTHGRDCRWSSISKLAGLSRSGKSCRLRWLNYLQPGLKRGSFSLQEAMLIINLHNNLGNKWAVIAKHLPGRTDSAVKNFWSSNMKKKLLTLNPNNEEIGVTLGYDHSQTVNDQDLQVNAPWPLLNHGQNIETGLDVDLPPLPPSFMGDSCPVLNHHLADNFDSSFDQNWDSNQLMMLFEPSEMNGMDLIIDTQPDIQLFNVVP